MYILYTYINFYCLKTLPTHIHTIIFLQGWNSPPLSGYPPLSETSLKS